MNIKNLIAGALSAGLAVLATAALKSQPWNSSDYAKASEDEQKAALEAFASEFAANLSKGRESEFKLMRVRADAAADLVLVEMQLVGPAFDRADRFAAGQFKLTMGPHFCRSRKIARMVDQGVRIDLRVNRPSRGPLVAMTLDQAFCARFSA